MPTTNFKELKDIKKTIILHTSKENVWKSISTSEGLASWWMENTFKPEVGYDFVLKAGEFGDSKCKVTELIPFKKLSFDWGTDWHLTFELKELEPNKVEFTLTHAGWDINKETAFGQSHKETRDIMNNGWESLVKIKLVEFVEN